MPRHGGRLPQLDDAFMALLAARLETAPVVETAPLAAPVVDRAPLVEAKRCDSSQRR